MANPKKKPTLSKAILNLIFLVPTFFSILSKIATLVEFEARLAGKSLIRLIVLSIVFGTLLTATWLGVLAVLFSYLQSLLLTPLLSLFIILLLNIVLLVIIGFCLNSTKKNLLFPEIRNQLRYLHRMFRD